LIRLLLKTIFACTLLFALCIALIRAQPYDDSELRAFLTPPEGCPAPCFIGIRPGVTTVEEAVAILEAHEWVEDVNVNEIGVLWNWNNRQPTFLLMNQAAFDAALTFTYGIVTSVHIITSIRFADLWNLIGTPEQGQYGLAIVRNGGDAVVQSMFQDIEYDNIDLRVRTVTPCPITPSRVFNSTSEFEWHTRNIHYDPYYYLDIVGLAIYC
jgi:hypothetical protein